MTILRDFTAKLLNGNLFKNLAPGIVRPQSIYAKEGESISFRCASYYRAVWKLNGVRLPKMAVDRNSNLNIEHVKSGDEGVYTCESTDPNGEEKIGYGKLTIVGRQ